MRATTAAAAALALLFAAPVTAQREQEATAQRPEPDNTGPGDDIGTLPWWRPDGSANATQGGSGSAQGNASGGSEQHPDDDEFPPGSTTAGPGQSVSNLDGVSADNRVTSNGDVRLSPINGNPDSHSVVDMDSGARTDVEGIDHNDRVFTSNGSEGTISGDGGDVYMGTNSEFTVTNNAPPGGNNITVHTPNSIIAVGPGDSPTITTGSNNSLRSPYVPWAAPRVQVFLWERSVRGDWRRFSALGYSDPFSSTVSIVGPERIRRTLGDEWEAWAEPYRARYTAAEWRAIWR